jgi:hypothetical protein
MSMVRVAGTDAYQMIIVDHEGTEVDVRRIVVFAEGKAVKGLGPISSGEETLLCAAQLNARGGAPRRSHWFSIAVR